MKMLANQRHSDFKLPRHRLNRAAWVVAPLVAVSLLSNCTTKEDAGIAANLLMHGALQGAEAVEFEKKGKIKSGGHEFIIQKHRTTGDYSIIDPTGRRHACATRSCGITAHHVGQELSAAATAAEGGGGGGGGGGSH